MENYTNILRFNPQKNHPQKSLRRITRIYCRDLKNFIEKGKKEFPRISRKEEGYSENNMIYHGFMMRELFHLQMPKASRCVRI